MRLSLTLLGCRLLIATGADVEADAAVEGPPAVLSNTAGTFEVAPAVEPDVTPEDHYGFRSTR